MLSSTAPTGWSSMSVAPEVADIRGSAAEISSQPVSWPTSASAISHPNEGQPGAKSSVPDGSPSTKATAQAESVARRSECDCVPLAPLSRIRNR